MDGKSKCKILKEIRAKIAQENDIEYVTSACKFQGNCSGTCPKCEAEVRYLEEELQKRQVLGKKIAVAGVAAALVVSAAGCDLFDLPISKKHRRKLKSCKSKAICIFIRDQKAISNMLKI